MSGRGDDDVHEPEDSGGDQSGAVVDGQHAAGDGGGKYEIADIVPVPRNKRTPFVALENRDSLEAIVRQKRLPGNRLNNRLRVDITPQGPIALARGVPLTRPPVDVWLADFAEH